MTKLMLVLLCITGTANASLFDNEIDAVEMANAVAHCPTELSQLLKGRENVNDVGGEFTRQTIKISTKNYTIKSQTGGGFERPTPGATLNISVQVTQAPDNISDGSSTLIWTCNLKR